MKLNSKLNSSGLKYFDDFLGEVYSSQTTYDIFRALKKLTISVGYQKFIFMKLPADLEIKLSEIAVVTNWDPELIRAYDAIRVISTSSIVKKLKQSVLPLYWELDSSSDNTLESTDHEVEALFRDFELLNGIYISVADKHGNRGALGLAGNRLKPDQSELINLSYLASYAYEELTNFEFQVNASSEHLTERERECVYWTAAGKTSGEVGSILDISENTVNHYLSSAALKLGAVNKAHTVAKAFRLGILE